MAFIYKDCYRKHLVLFLVKIAIGKEKATGIYVTGTPLSQWSLCYPVWKLAKKITYTLLFK